MAIRLLLAQTGAIAIDLFVRFVCRFDSVRLCAVVLSHVFAAEYLGVVENGPLSYCSALVPKQDNASSLMKERNKRIFVTDM